MTRRADPIGYDRLPPQPDIAALVAAGAEAVARHQADADRVRLELADAIDLLRTFVWAVHEGDAAALDATYRAALDFLR